MSTHPHLALVLQKNKGENCAKRIRIDDTAQFEILALYYSGELGYKRHEALVMVKACHAAREMATLAMVGGLGTLRLAAQKCDEIILPDKMKTLDMIGLNCICAAETWRQGVSSSGASSSLRSAMDGDLEDYSPEIRGGTWMEGHCKGKVFMFMDILMWDLNDTLYIMSRNQRAEVADLLWTAGQWGMYCIEYRSTLGGGLRDRSSL